MVLVKNLLIFCNTFAVITTQETFRLNNDNGTEKIMNLIFFSILVVLCAKYSDT